MKNIIFFKIQINYKSGNTVEGWFQKFTFNNKEVEWFNFNSNIDNLIFVNNFLNKYNSFDDISEEDKINLVEKTSSGVIRINYDEIESVFHIDTKILTNINVNHYYELEKYAEYLNDNNISNQD